ncbi:hypothetical protein TNCT_680362 [Trichonephila clavata]|nr:hypothetical protein TNCT_680362 [Trichonephila clavata]
MWTVRCAIGYDIVRYNYIICQSNGKWGTSPTCQKSSCPDDPCSCLPLIPSEGLILKKESCSRKITVPNITQNLITLKHNCNFEKRNEDYAIACPQGYSSRIEDVIACLNYNS